MSVDQRADGDRYDDRRERAGKVEDAARQTNQMTRREGCHKHPGDRRQTVAKEGDGHKQDDQRGVIGVVGAKDKQRQRHPQNDRCFTGEAGRHAATNQTVRYKPRQQHADEGREVRDGGDVAGFNKVHMAILHQIGREPGQEEPEGGRDGELAEVDANQLTAFKHQPQILPAERTLSGVLAAFHDRAAVAQVIQFGFRYGFVIQRIAVDAVPQHAPNHPCYAGNQKQPAPAEEILDVKQHRRHQRHADKLGGRVNTDCRGAFLLREPAGDHAVV